MRTFDARIKLFSNDSHNNCRRSGEALKNTGGPGGPGGKVGSNGDCGGAIGGGKVKGRWKSALSRLSYGKR